MCQLTEQQIAIVTNDVENEGINFSHLKFDLIDHVCCDIESCLAKGIAFNQAYDLVKKEFGIKGLRQIQQDTLMLIDKNYRIMKKSMKMIGVLAMALMAFGALFKIFHWQGASFLLMAGFFFTTLVFFPSFLYVVYKEANEKKDTPLFIIGFIGGLLFMIGVLFKIQHFPGAALLIFSGLGTIALLLLPLIIVLKAKTTAINKTVFTIGIISLMVFLIGLILKIQHWPGATTLLTVGSATLVLIFVPAFYNLEVAKSEKPRADFIFGIIALSYFIVFGFLLSMNLNENILIDFKIQDKSFSNTSAYLAQQNTKLLKNSNTDCVMQLAKQADIVYDYIETIKVMIVQDQYDCTKDEAIQIYSSGKLIRGKESTVNFILPENNPNSPLPKLKAELEVFNRFYQSFLTDSANTTTTPNILFNTENKVDGYDNHPISWENYHFQNELQSAALNKLSLWQYNIRLTENTVLFSLVSNKKNN